MTFLSSLAALRFLASVGFICYLFVWVFGNFFPPVSCGVSCWDLTIKPSQLPWPSFMCWLLKSCAEQKKRIPEMNLCAHPSAGSKCPGCN